MTATADYEPLQPQRRRKEPEASLLAKGADAFRETPVPGVHAPWSRWECIDEYGQSTGHGTYDQVVRMGSMPTCPTCGSTRARPAADEE